MVYSNDCEKRQNRNSGGGFSDLSGDHAIGSDTQPTQKKQSGADR